jgi:nitrogen fixation-related uncharacterized protein
MKATVRFAKWAIIMGSLALLVAPSPAFAHDNVGGDELAVANWMLISALVVAAMGIVAIIWAVRAGQFTNVEASKYSMIELSDDYDAVMAQAEARERAAKEAAQKSAEQAKGSEKAAPKPEPASGTAQI